MYRKFWLHVLSVFLSSRLENTGGTPARNRDKKINNTSGGSTLDTSGDVKANADDV